MATYTKNINLLKPAEQEKYDVNLRNNNWDKIDKAIGDTSDVIKKHKEANPIDHPDGSVTTPKLKDKCVTPAKLSEELNLKLKNDFVKRSGDTMQGNLTLENNKRVYFNNDENITHASIYINNNNTLDIGVNNLPDKAVNRISLCSVEKPQWYNTKNGTKILATEEYVDTEANKRVKKTGDTMTGDLNLNNDAKLTIERKAGGGAHTIGDGGVTSGQTNLDIGNKNFTPQANLCCYNRPGWYGKDKTNTFKPLMTLQDISVTYGNIRDGGFLPIPEGFNENECNWLLSMDQSNIEKWYVDIREGGACNMINLECWREGRRVHVGSRFKGIDGISLTYDGSLSKRNGEDIWLPGSANYICIAVKKA